MGTQDTLQGLSANKPCELYLVAIARKEPNAHNRTLLTALYAKITVVVEQPEHLIDQANDPWQGFQAADSNESHSNTQCYGSIL